LFGNCVLCPLSYGFWLLIWYIIILLKFEQRCVHKDYFILWKYNRFLHTFLGKTGWSSTSDRNVMSFREWKITRAFPKTDVSTYFFHKPTTFTIATPRDPRHWSVTNWHKLPDEYHWALWNTHHIKLTFVTPTYYNKLSSFQLI
jgi:hypothetical protein